MLDFLRLLAPRHADALQPVSPLHRPGAAVADETVQAAAMDAAHLDDAAVGHPGPGRRRDHDRPLPGASADDAADPAPRPGPRLPGVSRSKAPATPARQPADAPGTYDARVDLAQRQPPVLPVADGPIVAPRRADGSGAPVLPPVAVAPRSPVGHALPSDRQPVHARTSPPVLRDPVSPTTVAMHAPGQVSPPPPPAIHVSIDRVEVRAPAPAKAPQRQRPRSEREPQSLHDYLRGKVAP